MCVRACACVCLLERERACVCLSLHVCVQNPCLCVSEQVPVSCFCVLCFNRERVRKRDRLLSSKTEKAFISVGSNCYNHVYFWLEWLLMNLEKLTVKRINRTRGYNNDHDNKNNKLTKLLLTACVFVLFFAPSFLIFVSLRMQKKNLRNKDGAQPNPQIEVLSGTCSSLDNVVLEHTNMIFHIKVSVERLSLSSNVFTWSN